MKCLFFLHVWSLVFFFFSSLRRPVSMFVPSLWGSGRRSRCPHSQLRRSSADLPWRSGCRAQGTARGGGSRRRRTGRKSKGRRERSNQGECTMDMTVDDKVFAQNLSQWGVRCHHQVWKSALYVHAQRTVCTTQLSKSTSSLVYLLRIVSCMLLCVFTFHLLLFVMML